MGLETLRERLPDYARDTRSNLDSVLGASPLSPSAAWGTALACAVTARNPTVLREIEAEARERVSAGVVEAAKAAASVMAMNNVYYRATHLIGDPAYRALPARLRMRAVAVHPRSGAVDRADFELWCLAVSAVTGCGVCLESHERKLVASGVPRETVQEALRIAAVIHATAVTLEAEQVLSPRHDPGGRAEAVPPSAPGTPPGPEAGGRERLRW